MYQDLNSKVYEKLSEILGLKFKTQIKNSCIDLEEIHLMTDLITQKEQYVLFLDKRVIQFTTKEEFIKKFIRHLKENLQEFNDEYKQLRNQEQNDMFIDKTYIYNRDEHLSHCSSKQIALLEKMREFLERESE